MYAKPSTYASRTRPRQQSQGQWTQFLLEIGRSSLVYGISVERRPWAAGKLAGRQPVKNQDGGKEKRGAKNVSASLESIHIYRMIVHFGPSCSLEIIQGLHYVVAEVVRCSSYVELLIFTKGIFGD